MVAAARIVGESELRADLPEDWLAQFDDTEESVRSLGVSFLDLHYDAKIFVQQYSHGTGSHESTADALRSRRQYVRACALSLDGAFTADADPLWTFLQRELSYKHILYKKLLFGKDDKDKPPKRSASAPPGTTRAKRPEVRYAETHFAAKCGASIQEAPGALYKEQQNWHAASKPENFGPPTSMTTFVANPASAEITAVLADGPLARPNPERSVDFLFDAEPPHVTTHKGATQKAVAYIRRRADFESRCGGSSTFDTLGGCFAHHTSRTEGQKRGPPHDHRNDHAEECPLREIIERLIDSTPSSL